MCCLALIQAVLATKLFLRCTVPFDTPLLLNGTSFVWPPVGLVSLLDRGLGPRPSTLPSHPGRLVLWLLQEQSRPAFSDSDGNLEIIVCGDCTVKSNGGGGSTSKSICWRSALTLRLPRRLSLKVGTDTGRDISSRK